MSGGTLTTALPGVVLAGAVVTASLLATRVLGVPLPSATVGVLLGVLVANAASPGPVFKPGLDLCVKKLLRLGIVLVGIKLSFVEVAGAGKAAVPIVLALVAIALLAGPLLARALGASPRLGLLAGASTAICGITATLAVAPVVEAEDREVAYTVANVTLCGLVGMLLYPFAAHALLGEHATAAGVFLGTSIHDTSQVTGAALCYRDSFGSEAAMKAAIVAKLVRNTTLVAVVPLLAWFHARSAAGKGRKVPMAGLFPLFVLGFLGMAILSSIGDAGVSGGGTAFGLLDGEAWKTAKAGIAVVGTDGCLALALAALGLSTRFSVFRELGVRPLLLGVAAAALVAGCSMGLCAAFGAHLG
jgi:uncharacterized integral membrane protein (TIGR00698 family)